MQDGNGTLLDSMLLAWLAIRALEEDPGSGVLTSEIARSLARSMGAEPAKARGTLQRLLQGLAERGLVSSLAPSRKRAAPRWVLSSTGRKAALDALGLPALPERQRVDWKWAQKILLVRAFGQPLPASLRRAGESEWLAAWFLAKHHGLPRASDTTPRQVLTQLAARAAGVPVPPRFSLAHALSMVVLGADHPGPAPFNLAVFAHRVNDAARQAPTGRWLDDRVFIAHVWKEVQRRGDDPEMTFAQFQGHLVTAHNARLVRLSRGDLIAALPADDVRASETDDGEATFHFVRLDLAQPEGGKQ
jgi:hypothetical protein